MQNKNVVVVGAGIVGVCCALWIQRSGHRVTLIDSKPPGNGASFGNACTIADYGCIPVNNPRLITTLPRLMFARDTPLSVDFGYALGNLGWMLRFLSHCRRHKVDQIISDLGSLLSQTAVGLEPLVNASHAADLFRQRGCLYVYQTKARFDAAAADNQKRKQQGVSFEILSPAEIRQREPGLKPDFHAGLLFSKAQHTINPHTLVTRLFDHFIANGGAFNQQSVLGIGDNNIINLGAVRRSRLLPLILRVSGNAAVCADKIVIAAGALSKRIAGAGLENLPLDTERGYHVQFAGCQSLLTAPVGWDEAGFYAIPMAQGLRFAGTVEIAGLDQPANQKRLDYLEKYAKKMLDIDQKPTQTWLGFRPTMPDALPVIGPSRHSANILYAFGHQHLGLTLGGITGKLIAQLVDGAPTSLNIEAFSADRFR